MKVPAKQIIFNPIHFLAFGFGSGLAPKAPGTVGTLVAVPLVALSIQLDLISYLVMVVAIILVGIYLCHQSAKQLGVHDHPGIVWDEFAGLFITFIAIPFSWTNLVLGFVLFRFFDIVKPWPIKWIDTQVEGGLGIMLDDIIAGLFAWAVLVLINNYWFGL